MRILRVEFQNINLFEKGIIIDFIAKDRVTSPEGVYKFNNKYHTQNVLAFVGANATGKTTVLKLLHFCFKIIINKSPLADIINPNSVLVNDSVMIVDLFDEKNKKYNRLKSVFTNKQSNSSSSNNSEYIFKAEYFYEKKLSDVSNKSSISYFDESMLIGTRESLNEYLKNIKENITGGRGGIKTILKDNQSIYSFYTSDFDSDEEKSKYNTGNDAQSAISLQNMLNIYVKEGDANMIDINIFDNSIERMSLVDKQLNVKFKNNDFLKSCSMIDNHYLLSSGTSKGGNLLSLVRKAIRNGGYLIIDELENHFHKKLSEFIISLFNDETINKMGATLIFSTHYSELIDSIDRKDNIFITVRDKSYISKLINYSDEIKRIENKKSEVLLSNYIKGTAPSYDAIQKFRESVWD